MTALPFHASRQRKYMRARARVCVCVCVCDGIQIVFLRVRICRVQGLGSGQGTIPSCFRVLHRIFMCPTCFFPRATLTWHTSHAVNVWTSFGTSFSNFALPRPCPRSMTQATVCQVVLSCPFQTQKAFHHHIRHTIIPHILTHIHSRKAFDL